MLSMAALLVFANAANTADDPSMAIEHGWPFLCYHDCIMCTEGGMVWDVRNLFLNLLTSAALTSFVGFSVLRTMQNYERFLRRHHQIGNSLDRERHQVLEPRASSCGLGRCKGESE